MLTLLRRQLPHDRRRIHFAVPLTSASGFLGKDLFPDPLPVATEVLVVIGFLAMIPMFTARYRSKRHWVEIISIGNVIVALSAICSRRGSSAGTV